MGSMLCPVLISRFAEVRALTAALDRVQDHDGGVIVVTGDAGVGKSRLVAEVSSLASARGFTVLGGRATQSTVPVPFRPITEALIRAARAGLVPDTPEIADYRPALGSLVPEWRRPGDDNAEISAVILGEALLRLLALPAGGSLLVLEDLHWADPETLAIVEYLADNLAGTTAACLVTTRDSEPSAGLDAVRSMSARRAVAVVPVPRLTGSEVRQMAAACLGTEYLPPAVSRLLADCDGLPFAVEEILAAAVSSGELVRGPAGWHVNEHVTTGVPASIARSVRNRLATLGPKASNVIASAAVLGRQFDWTLLPSVAGVTEGEVLGALYQARDSQLIEPIDASTSWFRFRHSLTRDAIVSELLPPESARRSARAVAVIEEAHPGLPGTWCQLAAELHEAASHPEQAALLLFQVGRRARHRGALSSAITSLRDARRLLAQAPASDPMPGIEIGEVLAEALALSGDYDELSLLAGSLIAELDRAGADPRRQALIMITVARTRPEDHPKTAEAHLAAARDIADRLGDACLASWIDAAAARCALYAGDLDRADELAHQSLAFADAAGASGWAAELAIDVLEVIGYRERLRDLGTARDAFMRAYRLACQECLPVRRINAMHHLGAIDVLEGGGTGRLREALALAHQAGAISLATHIELLLAGFWSLGTDLDRALESARRCEHTARTIGAKRMEVMALCIQAFVHGIRTDHRAAEGVIERAERVLPGDPEVLFSIWGMIRVTSSLFDDDIARALAESARARAYAEQAARAARPGPGPLCPSSRFSPMHVSPVHAPLNFPRRVWGWFVLLQAVAGDSAAAELRAARAAGAAVGWNLGCMAYAEAVLEGRAGRRQRADELAEEGSAHFRPFAPWWNHLARRLVAQAAFDDGWGRPADWLREAAGEFEASGHDHLAAACRGMLRRAGHRVPRSGRGRARVPAQMRRLGITSREMDVFLLVAQGLSNAEIGTRLFISPKTVETHVASLITKTGQAGRRELVAHAARLASPGALTQAGACGNSGCA
jgi:DNA-binding CsgD family transcriptional regulator/tetratricopeptide (TPR) repeat protein